MKRVQLLNPVVAERIAAGEVIERPASVVKELIENSLDASATEVAVILEDGGKALIEVLDNGHGIHPDDLAVCIQRHATSKLSTLEDLEKLTTLGFRGEALPSVAAVSEMTILSRAQDQSTAYELNVTAGGKPKAITFGHFLNSPHGTRIRASGLFSQIPARLKFLKSQGAEVAQVREWMERLALTHPQTGFRLMSDDRTVLNLRPQNEIERVRQLLADGEDFPIATAESEIARVHWIQGLSSAQTKKLIQVVNGRVVKDRMLQQAILAPFRQALLPGQFPAVALFLKVDPASIDVNVHPTKTEIRFLDSRNIFHAIDRLLESLIAERGAFAHVGGPSPSPASPLLTPQWEAPQPKWTAREPQPMQQSWTFTSTPVVPVPASSAPTDTLAAPPLSKTEAQPFPFHDGLARFAGILFNTYIVYDLGEELSLIDQHAAHERIRYEKLKRSWLNQGESHQPARQALLIPEAVRFAPESRLMLEKRIPWMEKLGFEAEIFGEDTVLFRTVPTGWGTDSLRTRLKNLVDRTLEIESESDALAFDEQLFESLASEACHSAIRAGDRLEEPEARKLAEQLFECKHPWNCPHGRPTVVRVPRSRLEEWFQRRV